MPLLLDAVQATLRLGMKWDARRRPIATSLDTLRASLIVLERVLPDLDEEVLRHGIGRERHRQRPVRIVLARPWTRELAPLAGLTFLELVEEARRGRLETIELVEALAASPETRVPAYGGEVSAKAYARFLAVSSPGLFSSSEVKVEHVPAPRR